MKRKKNHGARKKTYPVPIKSSLGTETEEKQGTSKILGVQWDATEDEFCFDLKGAFNLMSEVKDP